MKLIRHNNQMRIGYTQSSDEEDDGYDPEMNNFLTMMKGHQIDFKEVKMVERDDD